MEIVIIFVFITAISAFFYVRFAGVFSKPSDQGFHFAPSPRRSIGYFSVGVLAIITALIMSFIAPRASQALWLLSPGIIFSILGFVEFKSVKLPVLSIYDDRVMVGDLSILRSDIVFTDQAGTVRLQSGQVHQLPFDMLRAGDRAKAVDMLVKPVTRRISTNFKCVEKNREQLVRGVYPFQVHTRWIDPDTKETHTFKSENIWFDPSDYITTKSIEVVIDPNDHNNYHVDISFLPDLP
jgi:hypothetical protein